MNRLPVLSDHELHGVLLNALATAADEYDYQAENNDSFDARIREQFATQAKEARALADKLEEESVDV